MRVNLGAGKAIKRETEWVNYDIRPQDPIVHKLNLEHDVFPHKDSEVSYIQAIDVLEHIENLRHLMNECHRILHPDGEFYIEVPLFPHEDAVKDPTHVRYFVAETFKYFADYKETCEMYGFLQWEIKRLREEGHRLYVILRPIK